MSKRVGQPDHQPSSASETGAEALQSSSDLCGPAEPLDGHEDNDHFALIYEDQAEQFATVVPFIRDGLERGERCMYMVEDNSQDELIDALRDGGIDVDAALDAGQLSIHSIEETYLKGGKFDIDEARTLLGDAMEEALDEYEGFRVTAEETWLVGDETAQRDFMACEAHVNNLIEGEAGMALCQYNRAELPPEVIEDVITTHPYLIYDDTVCPNDYYTPPEEYFGPGHLARDNDRKLETLVDRTNARASLQTRERYEREMYEITSDPDRSFQEKLDALFDLGCEWFDLDIGGLAKVDPDTDMFEVEVVSDDHDYLVPGAQADLSETYCRVATDNGTGATVAEPVEVTEPIGDGFEGKLCYEQFGVRAYLGSYLECEETADRTFWFVSTEPRETEFSEAERTFHHLMGQWVQSELERRERERELRETKNRFETVFEQSNDGIFIIDPDADELVDANPAAAEMTGYSSDELLSLPPSNLHPDELEHFHSFLDRVLETGSAWSEDLHCRHRDGRDIPVEISASSIALDGRDLVLAHIRHIEDRKEHERYQRELYEIIANNALSPDEKFERMLELGCERLDLSVGMLTHEREDSFEIERMHGTHPDLGEGTHTPPLTDNYCRRVVDTGEPISVADAEEAGWDGDALYHEFGLACYAGVQLTVGDDAYGTICFTDLSSREAEFTEAEQTFLDLMGQCASYELERNHRESELQQKNDRLESFASMLAHELRNPVTIGQIYTNQLPADSESGAVDYVAEAFDRIEDMIDVMLVLTRGRNAVGERSSVDLSDVAQEAWDNVDAPEAALDIAIDRTIQADETYIQHFVRNLLENAVEHGGAAVTVTVGELPTGFYVADDGTGIPADERDAIFDEGYTTASENGGTGLGLAFVQKLAEVFEWDYAVAESDSGGARFEFRNVT